VNRLIGWGTYDKYGGLVREGKQHLTADGWTTLCGLTIPGRVTRDYTYGASEEMCLSCQRSEASA